MSMGEREFVRLETNDWRQADKASDTVASFAAMLNTSGCQEHGRRSSRDNVPPELADWPMPAEVLTCNAESKGTGAVDGDEETRRCAWLSLRKGYVLRLNKGVINMIKAAVSLAAASTRHFHHLLRLLSLFRLPLL